MQFLQKCSINSSAKYQNSVYVLMDICNQRNKCNWAKDSFEWIAISPNGMKENCPDKIDAAFINAVLECTGDGFKKENNMREDEKEVNRFTEIEDFIKAANFLEITDILASFWFVNNEIDVDKMGT